MGTNPFMYDSDSDGLKDFEDPNPTGLEEKKTPSLTLTRSASPSTIQEGGTTTITIRMENIGTGDAKNVEVRNTLHTGCILRNGSGYIPVWPNGSMIKENIIIGKFEEIKSGDHRRLKYSLEVCEYYSRYHFDQSFEVITQPAVATYEDADGNSYRAASTLLHINVQVVDSDGDGWSDNKERRMGTNPLSDDSDSDGLKDFEDPNPTGLEEKKSGLEKVGFLGSLAFLAVIAFIIFMLISRACSSHEYSYKEILESIFAFLVVISGPILIIGGIILYVGNRSGAFPTFPFAGFITMLLGWLILFLILSAGEN